MQSVLGENDWGALALAEEESAKSRVQTGEGVKGEGEGARVER